MCGLAGIFGFLGIERTRDAIERMLEVQTHRGPDSSGNWCGSVHGVNVGLGLRRLKILDLSDAANQPMISEDGRFVLVFNGEIYNYVELRAELATTGTVFRTQSDTEVVLESLVKWGSTAFARFNGMWALALLDRNMGEVTLSRDRFGIKPLYTYIHDKDVFISSEIKGILCATREKFKISPSVANAFLQQNLLCATGSTFFVGINEFPAGCWAKISLSKTDKIAIQPKHYWTIPTRSNGDSSEDELIEKVRTTFVDAVKLRLRSDVPVGMLLSGGTDSSAIAAAIHHLDPCRDDIKLISAVAENGNDEEPFIDIMAGHLKRGVEKVVLNYEASRALDLITEVSWFNDEPVGSFSTVAHYLLMNRARDLGVTVLLSGQGADESLCGYKKYLGFYVQELLSSGQWLRAARTVRSFIENNTVLPQVDYGEMKRYLPQWLRLPEIDVRGANLMEFNEGIRVGLNGGGVVDRQVMDLERLSVPALVHYEDRMSMAVAREIRLPFLDYRLVSLLVALPVEYKLRDGWTKWIFRRAMEPLLPKEIAWRKDKQHFIVPQNEWFRSELSEYIRRFVKEEWITEHLGLIDRQKFHKRYEAYFSQPSGKGRLGFKDIFCPLALELWARRFEKYLSPLN
jgi:asparagine synthase (glutamine-hydrolysing)